MPESYDKEMRSRNWRLALYPEDPTHLEALSLLEQEGYKYVGIKHDKDVIMQEDIDKGKYTADQLGETKKEHFHVVVKFKNPVYKSALAKKLGIMPNYVQDCKNFDEACKYLVHATKKSADKYQYDNEDLFGPLAPIVVRSLGDDDEGSRVLEIVKQVDSFPGRASYRDLLVWACKNGYYSEFRRLGSGVKYLLDEHNSDEYADRMKEILKDDV